MAHGGYGQHRRVADRKQAARRRPKSLAVSKKAKTKPNSVSLKNLIRSTERMLRKDLPPEIKEAQEKKLEELKKQQEIHNRLAIERKLFLRDRKIKFFERRKIERRIRRVEKQQRTSSGQALETVLAAQLSQLKEDLEYVKFFPKTEKYVSLFMGGDDGEIVEKRNRLRKVIKENILAAAASGKELEETGSEDDGLLDASEDDFFLSGSSSDDGNADDEWTDKSTREQASSASGKATSGMSSDERNQRQISARALMPPPRPSNKSFSGSFKDKRFGGSTSKKSASWKSDFSTSSNTSNSTGFRRRGEALDPQTGNSDNVSSYSDARKPRRKRRPKKKKQQA